MRHNYFFMSDDPVTSTGTSTTTSATTTTTTTVPSDATGCGVAGGAWNPVTGTCVLPSVAPASGPPQLISAETLSGKTGAYYSKGPCPSNYTIQYENTNSSMCVPNAPIPQTITTTFAPATFGSALLPNITVPTIQQPVAPKPAPPKRSRPKQTGIVIDQKILMALGIGVVAAYALFNLRKG